MAEHGDQNEQDGLIHKALGGDEEALAHLFERYRGRLRKMVDLRLDRRIRQRVCPSDVLQEAYIDLARQLPKYQQYPKLPFFIWIRWLTGQRLAKVHHFHLDAEKRNAAKEVTLYRGRMPSATSHALASQLVGDSTSVAGKVLRAERLLKLQDILNDMAPEDREILAMRYFEQLTNSDIALIMEVSEPAAGMRHLRALRRLQNELQRASNVFGEDFSFLSKAERRGDAKQPENNNRTGRG